MSKKRRIYNKRIIRQRLVLFIMTGILALLIGRIAYLKVVKGEEYEGIAKTQQTEDFDNTIVANRGSIVDRNNQAFAVSTRVYDLALDVRVLVKYYDSAEQEKTISTLAGIDYLNLDYATLKSYITVDANGVPAADTHWKVLAKKLTREQKEEIEALGLKNGDFVALSAGTLGAEQKTAGVIRKLVGTSFDGYMKKECYEFCWVVDFPMYEIGEESGELEFCHNPFSMPQGGMDALNNQDPLEILAYQYDLVCNGVELSSGAVRNHDPEIMIKAFELVGLGEADVKAKFPAMYNAFCYGAPPHAGIAPGVDRMIMLICGEESIREIIPFPMNKNAIATIGILAFISQWNSFVWPLMVTKSDAHRVMPIGLLHFRDAVSSQVNLQMAGATIVIVPMLIFFLVFRKQIIAGVARGGIKG